MMIGMGLFWLAVIVSLAWLFSEAGGRRQRPPEEEPLTILDRRLADGAFSLDEYRQRRDALTGAAAPSRNREVTPPVSERSSK